MPSEGGFISSEQVEPAEPAESLKVCGESELRGEGEDPFADKRCSNESLLELVLLLPSDRRVSSPSPGEDGVCEPDVGDGEPDDEARSFTNCPVGSEASPDPDREPQ